MLGRFRLRLSDRVRVSVGRTTWENSGKETLSRLSDDSRKHRARLLRIVSRSGFRRADSDRSGFPDKMTRPGLDNRSAEHIPGPCPAQLAGGEAEKRAAGTLFYLFGVYLHRFMICHLYRAIRRSGAEDLGFYTSVIFEHQSIHT